MKFLFGFCLAVCVGFAASIIQPQSDRFKDSVAVIEAACQKYLGRPIDHFNGNAPQPDEFPWMAALSYFDERTQTQVFQCGGTIISEKFILTAAQCTMKGNPPNKVCLGRVNLEYANANNFYDIKEIIRRSDYTSLFKTNDVALIELTRPIVFSRYIRSACLETNLNDLGPNEKLIVTGWGSTSESRVVLSDQLMKGTVTTVTLPQCNEVFASLSARLGNSPALLNGIIKSQYCAVDPNGVSGPCQGDAGGPLQVFHNDDTAHVVGIVSFGIGCDPKIPSIYTRVAYYSEWIATNVWPDMFNRTQETMTLSTTTTTTQSPDTITTTAIPTSTPNIAIGIINEACNNYSLPSPNNDIFLDPLVDSDIYPWMAALGYFEDDKIVYRCAGILISESFVLTTAHCVEDAKLLIVRLGTVNSNENISSNYFVRDIIRHERYMAESKLNDIALIKLSRTVHFTSHVRPACLNTDLNDENPNITLKVIGLWSTSDGVPSEQLVEADVVTVLMSQCNQTFLGYKKQNSTEFQHGISESQYCARDPNGMAGTCDRDSGGPLQVFRNSYAAHIIGITSFGIGCNHSYPTIYTRVASFSKWIVAHVWSQ